MRRTDKEITDDAEINAVIERSRVCRLAMVREGRPYIVPLCFGHRDNTLYFHSAPMGQKIDFLRHNPNVCFEFDRVGRVRVAENPCDWGMEYQSVIGFGKAVLVSRLEEKRRALEIILGQYSDQRFHFSENMLKKTAVIRVAIEHLAGKQDKGPSGDGTGNQWG